MYIVAFAVPAQKLTHPVIPTENRHQLCVIYSHMRKILLRKLLGFTEIVQNIRETRDQSF